MESLSYTVSLNWLGLDPSEMGIALFGLRCQGHADAESGHDYRPSRPKGAPCVGA